MKKVQTIDFSDWLPYNGFAEGSGRSEKLWLQSQAGEIGLFKFPKVNPETLETTTEYVSEHLAHQIGDLLGIETACVDIGTYNNRIGSMSHLINQSDEEITEGDAFVTRKHPDYDLDLMQETTSGRYYCLDHLLEVTDDPNMITSLVQMMLFDYLIGNADRHQNNWAIIKKYVGQDRALSSERLCPLYDNGSSLCCYVNEKDVLSYLGTDTNRFNALTDTKSRSMIRVNGSIKRLPTHAEVVKELLQRFPEAKEFSEVMVSSMRRDVIESLVNSYDGVLTKNKIELIKKFLNRKVEMLVQIQEVKL